VTTRKDLKWNTRWQLQVKQTEMTDSGEEKHTGKWTKLDSIGYVDAGSADPKTGMFEPKIMGESDCKSMCKNLKRCNAFSYHTFDQKCIMNDDSVIYDSQWSFYPKNPPEANGHIDDSDEPEELGEAQGETTSAQVAAAIALSRGQHSQKMIRRQGSSVGGTGGKGRHKRHTDSKGSVPNGQQGKVADLSASAAPVRLGAGAVKAAWARVTDAVHEMDRNEHVEVTHDANQESQITPVELGDSANLQHSPAESVQNMEAGVKWKVDLQEPMMGELHAAFTA
jgi:hypothetical protein